MIVCEPLHMDRVSFNLYPHGEGSPLGRDSSTHPVTSAHGGYPGEVLKGILEVGECFHLASA